MLLHKNRPEMRLLHGYSVYWPVLATWNYVYYAWPDMTFWSIIINYPRDRTAKLVIRFRGRVVFYPQLFSEMRPLRYPKGSRINEVYCNYHYGMYIYWHFDLYGLNYFYTFVRHGIWTKPTGVIHNSRGHFLWTNLKSWWSNGGIAL